MEEETKKQKNENRDWTGFLVENIFGIVRSFVEGMFEEVHRAVFAFTKKIAQRAFLIFLIFLGIVFLLVGAARFLSAFYQLPGTGEALVGTLVILVSLTLYSFARNNN